MKLLSSLHVVISFHLASHDFLSIPGLAYITLSDWTHCMIQFVSVWCSAAYENMRLGLKLGCICLISSIPQPQEATVRKLQWQVSLCVLVFQVTWWPLMSAGCAQQHFGSGLWALWDQVGHRLPSKQEGSLETTRIEHSITHHVSEMLNVFIWLVLGNLHACELHALLPYFGDGCLQSPELTSLWVRKDNAFTSISILFYPRAYWYNETIILLSGVSGRLAETFRQVGFWKVLYSPTRPLCILVLYPFSSRRIHTFSVWQWAQFLSECVWWQYF